MLNVCEPSPPVPTMSTKFELSCTSTWFANSRITVAAAAISPIVSFFTRSPVMIAAAITGDMSPRMMSRIRCSISSWKISRCSIVRCSFLRVIVIVRLPSGGLRGRGACFRKFSSSAWPCSDRIDSGWNCTPSIGSVLWRTPMISPSSVHADTSRQSGSDSRSIASE